LDRQNLTFNIANTPREILVLQNLTFNIANIPREILIRQNLIFNIANTPREIWVRQNLIPKIGALRFLWGPLKLKNVLWFFSSNLQRINGEKAFHKSRN
jgi:hypothetical protein